VREDDELAEQAEREDLQAENQQQRCQQQCRSIGERLAEQHAIHSQVRDQHRADAERHGAEHAEEAQRLLGEAHQEEDAEQVEQVMHVLARPVDAPVAILRRLPHRHLADAETEPQREDRQEAMLVAVEIDFFEHLPPHRARAAAEIAQPRAGHPVDEAMESRASHASERIAVPRRAIADGHVGRAQSSEELANVGRLDLRVRRQRDDRAAARAFEAGGQRRSFAEIAREIDDREFLALAQQRLQGATHFGTRPIEHEDEFESGARCRDIRTVLAVQRGDVGGTARTDWHDDGKRRRCGLRLHGRL